MGMLSFGQAFIRGALRGNSEHTTPPGQMSSLLQVQQKNNLPVRPSHEHHHRIVLACLMGIAFGCKEKS